MYLFNIYIIFVFPYSQIRLLLAIVQNYIVCIYAEHDICDIKCPEATDLAPTPQKLLVVQFYKIVGFPKQKVTIM